MTDEHDADDELAELLDEREAAWAEFYEDGGPSHSGPVIPEGTDPDTALALVITWAINMVVCDQCGAKWGVLCDTGFVHPERVTKAFFSEMTEPLVIEQMIEEAGQ